MSVFAALHASVSIFETDGVLSMPIDTIKHESTSREQRGLGKFLSKSSGGLPMPRITNRMDPGVQ